jgi:hypothetical protein
VIFVFCVLQALYAIHLQRVFYTSWGPFFDSLSYHTMLARVMATSREMGIIDGIATAAGSGTIFLPLFLGAFAGLFTEPDRAIGTWLQSIWIFALSGSLWHYFRVCLRSGPFLALALSLPFVSLQMIYCSNGGLGDFRMDLHLYLLFGCAITWLYISLKTAKASAWIICGVFIACAALSRATAPIYLALTFALVLCPHLIGSGTREIVAVIRGCSLAGASAGILSLWFFILNYEHLHYYYVIWNPDANAHLPWTVSRRHVVFAFESIGAALLGAVLISTILLTCTSSRGLGTVTIPRILRSTRLWKIAPALAPLSFLVVRGAGLNPFVSMPGAFGILFFLLSLPGDLSKPSRRVKGIAGGLLMIACFASAWNGGLHNRPLPGMESSMAAYDGIVEAIVKDSGSHGCVKADLAAVTLGNMSLPAVENVAIFKHGLSPVGRTFQGGTFGLSFPHSSKFTPSAVVEWAEHGAMSPGQIIDKLADSARAEVEYAILPDDATAGYLAEHLSFNYINNYSALFRDTLLQRGKWERISGDLRISEKENYHVYANRELVGSR